MLSRGLGFSFLSCILQSSCCWKFPVALSACALVFSVGAAAPTWAQNGVVAGVEAGSFEAAQAAFQVGDFDKATTLWNRVIREARAAAQPERELRALVQLSQTLSAQGQWEMAETNLASAWVLAQRSGQPNDAILVKGALGSLHTQMNQPTSAEAALTEALAEAEKIGDTASIARLMNSVGSLRAIQDRREQANESFARSAVLARQLGDRSLEARATINQATLALRSGKTDEATRLLGEAERLALATEDAERVELLSSAGAVYLALAKRNDASPESKSLHLGEAGRLLGAASAEAKQLDNARLKSLALGAQGEVAEQQGRVDDALRVTRQARFFAQQSNAAYLSYRWEWQMGRLLRASGKIDDAIDSYRRSITTFRTLCNCGGTTAFSNYDETVRPLYYQLADLLLQRSGTGAGPQEVQALLTEARDTVELVKTAELSDYFQDECVSSGLAKTKDIDTVLNKTAVLYYIPLPDRTEILVGLKSGLQRVTVPVASNVLLARARRLRLQLQRPESDQYLAYSKELYDWLVRPVEAILQANETKTLVFVLDSSLRTIPMSALNDGASFLVEKYGVAVAPSLTLTDPQPLKAHNAKVFVGGLSEAVQGYDALASVPQEVRSIAKNYEVTTLLDKNFVRRSMSEKITNGDYSIVHLASHGEFGSRSANTYLLTYDGKVTLNELEGLIRPHQFRGEPVEMLVLSACQTAAGDDRAALGLAGIAVKAGARSAMASLWSVSDEATAELVANFYTELKEHPENSKATALQKAQLRLMKDERFQHPSFWAPYLLIGNWM